MAGAFFIRDGGALVPSLDARSPWSDQMLHGRLLAALAARAVEDKELEEGMTPVRLTIDLFRAAPLSPVTVSTTVVRDGRRVKVAEVGIFCEGREVARASVLMMRGGPPVAGRVWGPEAWEVPDPEALPEPPDPPDGRRFPMDIRMTNSDGFGTYARKRAWVREVRELVEGESPSPFVRAGGAADLANPLSNSGDAGLSFINGDLSVYLARLPEGEWLGLDVTTHISDGAVAVGACDLYDRRGRIGTASVASVANPRLGF
ncbi:MAG: thioesterase family protein [Acidimicrobiales bacterium]